MYRNRPITLFTYGETILTLILHKQKHILSIGDVLVPWMKGNYFCLKSQSKLKLVHADWFWLIGSLWSVTTPLQEKYIFTIFLKEFFIKDYIFCRGLPFILQYCLLFLVLALTHHLLLQREGENTLFCGEQWASCGWPGRGEISWIDTFHEQSSLHLSFMNSSTSIPSASGPASVLKDLSGSDCFQ